MRYFPRKRRGYFPLGVIFWGVRVFSGEGVSWGYFAQGIFSVGAFSGEYFSGVLSIGGFPRRRSIFRRGNFPRGIFQGRGGRFPGGNCRGTRRPYFFIYYKTN